MRGFTLIEVLVALAILSLALGAAVRSAGVAADGTVAMKQRVLGMWVAQDRLAAHSMRAGWPDIGVHRGNAEQARVQFVWRETVSGTPNPRFRRVEIEVFPAQSPDHAVATLVGYATRKE